MNLGKHLVHIIVTYIDETLLNPDAHKNDTLQAVWDCALVSESRRWERCGGCASCFVCRKQCLGKRKGLNSIHFNPFCQIYSSSMFEKVEEDTIDID